MNSQIHKNFRNTFQIYFEFHSKLQIIAHDMSTYTKFLAIMAYYIFLEEKVDVAVILCGKKMNNLI